MFSGSQDERLYTARCLYTASRVTRRHAGPPAIALGRYITTCSPLSRPARCRPGAGERRRAGRLQTRHRPPLPARALPAPSTPGFTLLLPRACEAPGGKAAVTPSESTQAPGPLGEQLQSQPQQRQERAFGARSGGPRGRGGQGEQPGRRPALSGRPRQRGRTSFLPRPPRRGRASGPGSPRPGERTPGAGRRPTRK